MMEWIRVEERLPRAWREIVLVYIPRADGDDDIVTAWRDEDGWYDRLECRDVPGVTHWMPLPAPPEEH